MRMLNTTRILPAVAVPQQRCCILGLHNELLRDLERAALVGVIVNAIFKTNVYTYGAGLEFKHVNPVDTPVQRLSHILLQGCCELDLIDGDIFDTHT